MKTFKCFEKIQRNFAEAFNNYRENLDNNWQKFKLNFIKLLETLKAILQIIIENSVKICSKIETFKQNMQKLKSLLSLELGEKVF